MNGERAIARHRVAVADCRRGCCGPSEGRRQSSTWGGGNEAARPEARLRRVHLANTRVSGYAIHRPNHRKAKHHSPMPLYPVGFSPPVSNQAAAMKKPAPHGHHATRDVTGASARPRDPGQGKKQPKGHGQQTCRGGAQPGGANQPERARPAANTESTRSRRGSAFGDSWTPTWPKVQRHHKGASRACATRGDWRTQEPRPKTDQHRHHAAAAFPWPRLRPNIFSRVSHAQILGWEAGVNR